MYRRLPDDERLGFGDIIRADWFFDLYLRHDAVALNRQQRDGRQFWISNIVPPRKEREPGKDAVLSHSDHTLGYGSSRRAVVVTDDCEMETLCRRGRGRILLAAIRDTTDAEVEQAQGRGTYRRFPLPADPETGLSAGIVELTGLVSVSLQSLVAESDTYERLAGLDADAQGRLSQAMCAHVTRHGPIVAARESAKLSGLMAANGDPEVVASLKSGEAPPDHLLAISESLTRALSSAWVLEGRVLNQVSDAWEMGEGSEESVAAVRAELATLKEHVDSAIQLLDEASS